jgi:hypothetical protein
MVYTLVTSNGKEKINASKETEQKKSSPYAGLDRYIKGLEKRYLARCVIGRSNRCSYYMKKLACVTRIPEHCFF